MAEGFEVEPAESKQHRRSIKAEIGLRPQPLHGSLPPCAHRTDHSFGKMLTNQTAPRVRDAPVPEVDHGVGKLKRCLVLYFEVQDTIIHTANCSVFKVSLSLGKVFLFPTQGSLNSHMLRDVKALTFTCSCLSSHPEVTTTYLLPTLSPRGVSQQKCHIVHCALSEFDLENVTAKSICHGREANSY